MKSKKTFFLVAVAVILIVLCVIGFQPNSDIPPGQPCDTHPEGNTYLDVDNGSSDAKDPTRPIVSSKPEPFNPQTSLPYTQIQLSDQVKIYQVECDPNEVINPAQSAYPGDPEFLPEEKDAGPLINEEGYNFRNDKVIALRIISAPST